jgi:hypothetical protein
LSDFYIWFLVGYISFTIQASSWLLSPLTPFFPPIFQFGSTNLKNPTIPTIEVGKKNAK